MALQPRAAAAGHRTRSSLGGGVLKSERKKKLEELFQIAVQLRLAEREAFFERHCADDAELRSELVELLNEDDHGTKDFLVSPLQSTAAGTHTSSNSAHDVPDGTSAVPESIGRYRLIEKIGEGGMGEVYLAEQHSPVRREVALKIVKRGMDSARIVARFERERQALALMEHPGIARIFDGGTTEGGRPYFVMEHVTGVSLIEYCDRERLSLSERLRLFIRVCAAVQHAHQKGVLHRDLKTANVLVTQRDGRPEPKVIDFGIARTLTTDRSDDAEQPTQVTEVVGTRHYMSPEQARLSDAQLDTRADVYSLGVLLFELLTGVLPLDPTTLRDKTPEEVQVAFLRHDPPTPSSRVAALEGELHRSLAERRASDPRALSRTLRGDLDWITLKAMAREPERRYASASELGSDVQRFLEHQPVIAGPPDVSYRVAKFVARHRLGVAVTTVLLVMILIGIAGTTLGMIEYRSKADEARLSAEQAQEAERLAQRERDKAEDARLAAERRAREARTVSDFLVDTIALADPEIARTPNVTLRAMLERTGQRIGPAFADFPVHEATLRDAIGRAFYSMDRLSLAEEHLQRSLALQQALPGFTNKERYRTARRLARVYEDTNSRNASEALNLAWSLGLELIEERSPQIAEDLFELFAGEEASLPIEDGLTTLRERWARRLPAGDPLWLVVADVLEFMGAAFGETESVVEARRMLEGALAIRRAELDPTDIELARTTTQLVRVLHSSGGHETSEALARSAIATYEMTLPQGHPRIAEARSMLGESLSLQVRSEQALPLLIESQEAILAVRSPSTRIGIDATLRLVAHYERTQQAAAAKPLRSVLARGLAFAKSPPWRLEPREAAFGPEHQDLCQTLARLDESVTDAYMSDLPLESHLSSLERLFDRVIALRRAELTDDDPLALVAVRALADHVSIFREVAPALHRRICDEVLEVLGPFRAELPDPIATIWHELAHVAMQDGDLGRATEALRAALEVERDAYGRTSFAALTVEAELIEIATHVGRSEALKAELLETWQACVMRLGYGHEATSIALANVIELGRRLAQPGLAERCLKEHLDPRNTRNSTLDSLDEQVWLTVLDPGYSSSLYERSLELSRRIVDDEPEEGTRWCTYALALYRVGRAEECLTAIDRVGELHDELDHEDLATRALAYELLGRAADAALALEEARRLEDESFFESPLVDEAERTVAASATRR